MRLLHSRAIVVSVLTLALALTGCSRFLNRDDDDPSPAPPPVPVAGAVNVTVTGPAPGLVTASGMVDVTGTVTGAQPTAVMVNGVTAKSSGKNSTSKAAQGWIAEDVPLSEGTNVLVVTATSPDGLMTQSVSQALRKDTQSPIIVIETPQDLDRFSTDTIAIAGVVNDVIPGATINDDDVTITINGMATPVMNKGFLLPAFTMVEGDNTIMAVVTDLAGNTSSHTITVSYEPDLLGSQIMVMSGNTQTAPVDSALPQSLTVLMTDSNGMPYSPPRPVTFTVSNGDGLLSLPSSDAAAGSGKSTITLFTDVNGMASMDLELGRRTGEGFHRVRVTTPGSLTFAEFCATSTPTLPVSIVVNSAPPASSAAGATLTQPLTAIVTDAGGNPTPAVSVTFDVTLGGGDFAGQPSVTVLTDLDGIATTPWTLGPSAGTANNRVEADFPGNAGLPAEFLISGVIPGLVGDTSISGVVINSSLQPIVGSVVSVVGTTLQTIADADGAFQILGVSPGSHELKVAASAANDPDNDIFYPDIAFAMTVVSGVDNTLRGPVILPFLQLDGAKMVGGSDDVILKLDGVPGMEIRVFANSTFMPDGSQTPLVMSNSQVKFDKVPMVPPQGTVPLTVGTLQPPGIHFDPPARVTYPNVAGLAPGDVGEMFAFHHDIGQFVNIGPGTVSADGSTVTSNPGFGLLQSGWHCLISMPGPTANCANDCTATIEWQHVKKDGSLGPVNSGAPVKLSCSDEDKASAKVTATFAPGGGTFDSQTWTGSGVTFSDATASGLMASVTVTALSAVEPTLITSPIYRVEVDDQADKTCQVEIEVTTSDIRFLDAKMKETNFANVSNWETAHFGVPPNHKTDVDMHKTDADRFYVEITDIARKGQAMVKGTVRTHNNDDKQVDTVVNFVAKEMPANSGIFKSDPFVLMSNMIDDAAAIGGVADGTPGDPTLNVFLPGDLTANPLKVLIGGKVTAHYDPATATGPAGTADADCNAEMSICKEGSIKTITVRPFLLKKTVGGAPVTTASEVNEDFALMNVVYAQCCVRIEDTALQTVDPPAAEAFMDVAYDHDNDPMTPAMNPNPGVFGFFDVNSNNLHDMGEPSKPFTDANGNSGYDFVVDLTDGLDEFDTSGALGNIPTREERNLLDSFADTNLSTIEMYVVNNLDQNSRGEAFSTDVPGFVANLKKVNAVITSSASVGMVGNTARDFVNAAHELGHVVLVPNGGHTDHLTLPGRINVMVGNGTDGSDGINNSKRYSDANCVLARKFGS